MKKNLGKIITGVWLTAVVCVGLAAGAAAAGWSDNVGNGFFALAASSDAESSSALKRPEIQVNASGYESLKISWKKVTSYPVT